MTVLFHVALSADWEDAVETGVYAMSTRGVALAEQGFIHASYEHQVERVANAFYADLDQLVLLSIDGDALAAAGVDVIDESPTDDPADERFPHLYGALPVAAVTEARSWHRAPDAPWRLPSQIPTR